jgi:hypothetical protein
MLTPGRSRELVPDPGGGREHDTRVSRIGSNTQIQIPARPYVDALHQLTHEGEVSKGQLARRPSFRLLDRTAVFERASPLRKELNRRPLILFAKLHASEPRSPFSI